MTNNAQSYARLNVERAFVTFFPDRLSSFAACRVTMVQCIPHTSRKAGKTTTMVLRATIDERTA